MLIVYDSLTGNVQRFVDNLGMNAIKIKPGLQVNQPYVLITYTTGMGLVPPSVDAFLRDNADFLQGVAASGNKIWGYSYCKSADTIASMYSVPILSKFELSGTKKDIELFKERVQSLETH
jgi:protein involved in ribonucleotide reduction